VSDVTSAIENSPGFAVRKPEHVESDDVTDPNEIVPTYSLVVADPNC